MKVLTSCISLVVLASGVFDVIADDKCPPNRAAFKQLSITPSFISIFGNIPITIQGPPLNDVVKVQIRFHDVTTTTIDATISAGKVTGWVPYLYTNGRIQVDLIVTRTNTTVDTFYGFVYTQKHRTEVLFEVTSTTNIKLSWDKTQFDVGTPLKLVLLELVGGVFTSRGVIKTNIPNNGQFTGGLDIQGVEVIKKLTNVYVVQLESTTLTRPTVTQTSPAISNILNLLSTKSQAEIDKMCRDWYITDSGAPKDALPCPPTLQKAKLDERFEPVEDLKLYNPEAEQGYMQRVPSPSGAAQRCVYRGGKLLVGPPSGGNVRKVSPNGPGGETPHVVSDILPWFLCCNTNKDNCKLYYERRPSDDGSGYKDCHTGMITGDPHFTTFDGFYYTFLGLGEFWIVKSHDNDFSMQGRFTQFLSTQTTVCTTYVMKQRSCDGTVTIQLSLKKDYIEIMIDGQIVAFDSKAKLSKRTIIHNGASIAIYSQKDIRITFSTGYSFKFKYDPYVINMIAMVEGTLKNKFRGLFGVFDGNKANELTYPDGKVIPNNSNAKQIHDFGMHWKINCKDSLFTYPNDKGFESFQDDKYVPRLEAVDVKNLPPKAKEVCGETYQCLFDFTVTGNQEFAVSTLTTVQTFTTITQTFSVQTNKCANENSWLQWLCENGLSAT